MKLAPLTLAPATLALLAGFALLQTGNALQGTLLALRGQAEGFPGWAVGAIMSCFFAGMGLGAFLAPALIRRAGHLRAFSVFASLASAAALAHALVVELPAWLLIRAFTGLCVAGMVTGVESWLNASVDSGRRGELLAVYAAVGLGAGALGQLQIGLAPPTSFALFAWVSILLSLALVPASLSTAALPPGDLPPARLAVLPILRASPFGAGATVLAGMTLGAFFALGPVYARASGLDDAGTGRFMAAATGAAMLSQWPVGRLSDRVSRRSVAAVLAALACGALGFAIVATSAGPDGSAGEAPLLMLAAVLGAALFPTQAVAAAQVADRAPRAQLVAASGTLVLLLALGASSGPILAGAAMDALGPAGLPAGLMVFQAAIVALGLVRLAVRPSTDGHRARARWGLLQPVLGPLSTLRSRPPAPRSETSAAADAGGQG